MSDYLSRYPEAYAVPTIDAATIADLLINQFMPRHGAPRTLLSDRGSSSCLVWFGKPVSLWKRKKFLPPVIVLNVMAWLSVLMAPWHKVYPCTSAATRKIADL